MRLPDQLERNLRAVHPEANVWIERLPQLIQTLETRWQVRVGELAQNLSYNLVAFAEGENGTSYVLKASPPHDELRSEAQALKDYGGQGAVRLIEADLEAAALLLERLRPGDSFWMTQDDVLATQTCAKLLLELWRPVQDASMYRDLESWTRALPDYLKAYPEDGPIPPVMAQKAYALRRELLQDASESVLLHADLHHGNILSTTRQPYLAIDPKGIVGPRAYDTASFLINPPGLAEREDLRELLERRIHSFSEYLSLEMEEIAAWTYVHLMVSNCWLLEDFGATNHSSFAIANELETYF